MEKNIEDMYEPNKPYYSWYLTQRNTIENISYVYDKSMMLVTALIAATSPLKSWVENVNIVHDILIDPASPVKHTELIKGKVQALLNLGREGQYNSEIMLNILGGRKIKSFFTNLYWKYDSSVVTIDRYALCVAINCRENNVKYSGISDRVYSIVERAYMNVANKYHVLPSRVQAFCWEKLRRENNN